MNLSHLSTLFALKTRFRVLLGFVLLLMVVGFNYLLNAVDSGGWSSGFTHPLHGGDHFLAMLAVGVWAAQLRGKAIWLLPVTFVGVMSLGGIAGAAGLSIAGAEIIILLSCLVFALLVIRKIRFSNHINVIIVAFFAFFHGFAHGQEISTSASLISYTFGFMLATLLLHGAGILIVRLLVVVVALFISHLAYAQASANDGFSQVSPSYESTVNDGLSYVSPSYQADFFMAAQAVPPDDVGWAEVRSPSSYVLSPHSPKDDWKQPRTLSGGCVIVAKWLIADWLDSQRLNIHFLTGLGKTSPPVAINFDSSPRLFSVLPSATLGKPLSETILRFTLILLPHTLAIRFLTNGVGTTAPPVGIVISCHPLLRFAARFLHTLRNDLGRFSTFVLSTQKIYFKLKPLFRFQRTMCLFACLKNQNNKII
jgi:hydrogenase/urease accessory protein HupE